MTGLNSSFARSSFGVETTAGTIPASPSMTSVNDFFDIKASPNHIAQPSLITKGAARSHTLSSIPVAGEIGGSFTYGTLDPILETLFQGEWTSNVLKDARTIKTFFVENTMPAGQGGTNTYQRFRGVQALSGTISGEVGGDVKYKLDLGGIGSDDATTTALSGLTRTDAAASSILACTTGIGTIDLDGYTEDCISEFEMEFAYDGREPQEKLGSLDLCGITLGSPKFVIRGAFWLEANFAEKINAARSDHTAFSVTIPIGKDSGSKYNFEFPSCTFVDAHADLSQARAKVPFVINANFDETEDCVVKITRAVS